MYICVHPQGLVFVHSVYVHIMIYYACSVLQSIIISSSMYA